MKRAALATERIQSLDIWLNDLLVGTLVRTPGDYHAFNLSAAYRSMKDAPVLSLSLRSADGGLGGTPNRCAERYHRSLRTCCPKKSYARRWNGIMPRR